MDNVRDLRGLAWSSIDNDDPRDLDQVEVAERLPGGSIRILVGIADVDALVPKDSEVDKFARRNTATLYTGVHVPDALRGPVEQLSGVLCQMSIGAERAR